mmetsp:Transcript_47872/g.79320  ORF Transcript_47872/g.79320 Transcript_47872/m.79320 type:complete len:107 (-) Transcript_47872:12-332(-)
MSTAMNLLRNWKLQTFSPSPSDDDDTERAGGKKCLLLNVHHGATWCHFYPADDLHSLSKGCFAGHLPLGTGEIIIRHKGTIPFSGVLKFQRNEFRSKQQKRSAILL